MYSELTVFLWAMLSNPHIYHISRSSTVFRDTHMHAMSSVTEAVIFAMLGNFSIDRDAFKKAIDASSVQIT